MKKEPNSNVDESPDMEHHYAQMRNDEYSLNDPEIVKLKSWNGILIQMQLARHSLNSLLSPMANPNINITQNSFDQVVHLSNFSIQYGKCFASAHGGQVRLDGRKIFSGNQDIHRIHDRILEIRNTFAAHNGVSDLISHNIGSKNVDSTIYLRHFVTFVINENEFKEFSQALDFLEQHVVIRLNQSIDKIELSTGKKVLFEN